MKRFDVTEFMVYVVYGLFTIVVIVLVVFMIWGFITWEPPQ